MRFLRSSFIAIVSILLLFVIYFTYSEFFSIYKFGIVKKDYPVYFTKENNELNPNYFESTKGINDYSPLTKFKMESNGSYQIVSIEHLVRVGHYDMQLIPEIKDKNNLFFAIEFDNGNIDSVSVTHKYCGKDLELVGTYIYHYPTKPNGEIDDSKYFIVKKINSDLVNETNRFVYVKIYKMPWLQSSWLYQHLVRQKYWFTKPVEETITIKHLDKGKPSEVTYKFNIFWRVWSTLYGRFITIT